jgi:hypothetical protein
MSSADNSVPNQVIVALRLGWLTVESYSRLYRFASTGRKADSRPGGVDARFDFSDRALSALEALFQAVDHLHALSEVMKVPPPPFPRHDDLSAFLDSRPVLAEFQQQLNHWGTEVWTTLMTRDELDSRAFTYGGSLADTYWHASLKLEDLDNMLNERRLGYIVARLNSIASDLPQYVPELLEHTLKIWQIAPTVRMMDRAGRRKVLRRLESQAKVWHDLLFGGRTPESYISPAGLSRLGVGAIVSTAVVLVLGGIFVWFSTFFLYQSGNVMLLNNLTDLLGGPRIEFSFFQSSTILATVSALLVFLGGIFNRLSSWVGWVYHAFEHRYVIRSLQKAIARPWNGDTGS